VGTGQTHRFLSALELKLSPVTLTILLAVAMWLLARQTAGFRLAPELRLTVLLLLLAAGAAIGFAGVRALHQARTTVNPWRPQNSSELVVRGIYGRTRNPMYLGLILALLGWGLYLANIYAVLLGFTFVPYMNRFQIQPEERALTRAFGLDFLNYCRQVRRWL
jgi:protein-S-isoprenylcysteine O-methyltransferase Ste14